MSKAMVNKETVEHPFGDTIEVYFEEMDGDTFAYVGDAEAALDSTAVGDLLATYALVKVEKIARSVKRTRVV